jgi:hypothetical protein
MLSSPAQMGIDMMDLKARVDLPGGWVLDQAIAINNSGQVIATGIIPIGAGDVCARSFELGPCWIRGAATEGRKLGGTNRVDCESLNSVT